MNNSIFEKYKQNTNLYEWNDFPDVMWGLGFEMDCFESFTQYMKKCTLKLSEPKSEREKRKNILYALEHADKQIVGNFLFSEWRYWTHWAMSGYDEYEEDFMMRIMKILEEKMN